MDLRFRHLQELMSYGPTAVLTKYSSQLLQESLQHANHQIIRHADANNASVLSFSGRWYAVDLLVRTCSCGRFQCNNIPCGHAVAVIQV